ncbi:MAG: hypothetical protein HRT89_11760 [Lentisphaeria bacterium]|nr:hypothetical protein [Lentisphaeria bacterium]
MAQININHCKDDGFNCLYNADLITEEMVRELLKDEAAQLYSEKEQMLAFGNEARYKLTVNGELWFAKELKNKYWYSSIKNIFFSTDCWKAFQIGCKLVSYDINTPQPILAATVICGEETKQLLITRFIENAKGLADHVTSIKDQEHGRERVLDRVARTLAEFHKDGFCFKHINSTSIIVSNNDDKINFWYTALEAIGSNRFHFNTAFINTVAQACKDFHKNIHDEERIIFLRVCFDAALKNNIFKRPSQQEWFIKKTNQRVSELLNESTN